MIDPTRLDDPAFLSRHDGGGMGKLIAELPPQFGAEFEGAPTGKCEVGARPSRVWIAAMGGSAFAGEMIAAALEADGVGVSVVRGYDLPAPARAGDWLLAQSYSGNTEEVLSVFEQAGDRSLVRKAVASGGRLEALAEQTGTPCLKLEPGYPPRASAGFGYAAGACFARVLASDAADPALLDPRRLIDHLEAGRALWGPGSPLQDNEAKRIAAALMGRMPIVYGAEAVRPALVRWSAQLNENAKVFCHTAVLPEQNHNEIVAFSDPGVPLDSAVAVFLRLSDESGGMAKRIAVTRHFLEKRGISCLDVEARGATLMERLWWLCYLGDHVSLYRAALAEVDPTPVAAIDELKKKLSEDRS